MKIMRLRIGLWAALLMAAALANSTGAAEPPVTLNLHGYTAELTRWSTLAKRLPDDPKQAVTLRRQVPDHWSVNVDRQQFTVSTEWLRAALDRVVANPQSAVHASSEVRERLETMLSDAGELVLRSDTHDDRARATLQSILRRREFRSVRPPEERNTFWDQISEAFWRFVNGLLSHMGGHPIAAKVFLWGVVIALAVVFLAWLVVSVSDTSFSNLWSRRKRTLAQAATPPPTWRQWLDQSRTAAASGDYRAAIHFLYGAAIQRLAAAGAWQLDPARTHREYLRLLPADSFHGPPLNAITACFERVWYGAAQASAEDYEAARSQLESMR